MAKNLKIHFKSVQLNSNYMTGAGVSQSFARRNTHCMCGFHIMFTVNTLLSKTCMRSDKGKDVQKAYGIMGKNPNGNSAQTRAVIYTKAQKKEKKNMPVKD